MDDSYPWLRATIVLCPPNCCSPFATGCQSVSVSAFSFEPCCCERTYLRCLSEMMVRANSQSMCLTFSVLLVISSGESLRRRLSLWLSLLLYQNLCHLSLHASGARDQQHHPSARAECCFDLRVERSPMGEQPQRAFMCALETLKCLTSDLCFSVSEFGSSEAPVLLLTCVRRPGSC